MNPLYVRFYGQQSVNIFHVAIGNKLKDVIQEIEEETGQKVENASYTKHVDNL